MAKFRIREAVARAKENGKKVFLKDLAKEFWNSNERAEQANMTKLLSGRTRRINLEWIDIICKTCDCTPNYLFGYEEDNK